MIDELKDTKIVEKVGGRYKLTALIQKRLIELMEGARPLIENAEGLTQMEIVVREILEDKISPEFEAGSVDEPAEKSPGR